MPSFGYQIKGNAGILLETPEFTPMNLCQVIDLSGQYQSWQTPSPAQVVLNVPIDKNCCVFFRSTPTTTTYTGRELVMYTVTKGTQYWQVNFSARMEPCRLYVFSNYLPYIPNWGLFLYKNGNIFWHQNCLALDVKVYDRISLTGDVPVRGIKGAVLPAVIDTTYTDDEWGSPTTSVTQSFTVAGWIYKSGAYNWDVTVKTVLSEISINNSFLPHFENYEVRNIAYIDTTIYDQYYQQALGLN